MDTCCFGGLNLCKLFSYSPGAKITPRFGTQAPCDNPEKCSTGVETGFTIRTAMGVSLIPEAGRGRFFLDSHVKGTVVRKQREDLHNIQIFRSVEEMLRVYPDPRDSEMLAMFVATGLKGDGSAPDLIYLNNPSAFTNHAFGEHANVTYRWEGDTKVWFTTRAVAAGEEWLQDFSLYQRVPWFEDWLAERNLMSLRQQAEIFNKE